MFRLRAREMQLLAVDQHWQCDSLMLSGAGDTFGALLLQDDSAGNSSGFACRKDSIASPLWQCDAGNPNPPDCHVARPLTCTPNCMRAFCRLKSRQATLASATRLGMPWEARPMLRAYPSSRRLSRALLPWAFRMLMALTG